MFFKIQIIKKVVSNDANIEYRNKRRSRKKLGFGSFRNFMNVLGEYIILAKRVFTISQDDRKSIRDREVVITGTERDTRRGKGSI